MIAEAVSTTSASTMGSAAGNATTGAERVSPTAAKGMVPTGRDFNTQTKQPTLGSMPKLTKHTKIKKEEDINFLLNDKAFGYTKRDGSICVGTDIYSYCGSATRAKSCAVASIINLLTTQN